MRFGVSAGGRPEPLAPPHGRPKARPAPWAMPGVDEPYDAHHATARGRAPTPPSAAGGLAVGAVEQGSATARKEPISPPGPAVPRALGIWCGAGVVHRVPTHLGAWTSAVQGAPLLSRDLLATRSMCQLVGADLSSSARSRRRSRVECVIPPAGPPAVFAARRRPRSLVRDRSHLGCSRGVRALATFGSSSFLPGVPWAASPR